jgi:hypothetical protein
MTSWVIISLTLYKICSLLVGLALCYLGYRLFVLGISSPSGDLDAGGANYKLALKGTAPGIFLGLFGTIVIAVTPWKGLEFTDLASQSQLQALESKIRNNPLPAKPPF